jgi:nucleotide-binding universal stress UspA family protein/hemerythrin-like domain-containing protein
MYRHLLVPVDGSELSTANYVEAIRLAAALIARITFVHATADYAATSDGALNLAIDPQSFAERARGDTSAVLAKACAAASAAAVRCDTYSAVSDRPAEAILEAARKCGCDLIVMASHGATGLRALLTPSQTRKVLDNSPVALLVTRVEANDVHASANRAVAMIHDEHRSLAAVIRGMLNTVDEARRGEALDHQSLQQMLQYIHAFPERLHHPKEEKALHPVLLERHPEARVLIERLESEHLREYRLVAELDDALQACPDTASRDDAALVALHRKIDELARAVWAHMDAEERQLIPMARESLTEKDWAEVAKAFEGHRHPRLGDLPEEEFRRLFSAIADMLNLPKAKLSA